MDEEAAWLWTVWRLARDTGWSLEYIEELTLEAIQGYLTVLDAEKELQT